MRKIPKRIATTVRNTAKWMYIKLGSDMRGWCGPEDLEQEAYIRLHLKNLWDADNALIAHVTSLSSIDYARKKIPGYRRREQLQTCVLLNSDACNVFTDDVDRHISIRQLIPKLTPKKQAVITKILDGWGQIDIADQLGSKEAAVSRAKMDAIKKLRDVVCRY